MFGPPCGRRNIFSLEVGPHGPAPFFARLAAGDVLLGRRCWRFNYARPIAPDQVKASIWLWREIGVSTGSGETLQRDGRSRTVRRSSIKRCQMNSHVLLETV